jgi:hypothetical protein
MEKNMVLRLSALLFAVVCSLAVAAAEEQTDQNKMIGTWRGGFPDDKKPRYELIITAEKISGTNLQDGKSLGEGSWVLETVKKNIDATMTTPNKGRVFLGLYSLDGDTLKWASDNGRGNRPATLVHRPPQSFLMVLTRQK